MASARFSPRFNGIQTEASLFCHKIDINMVLASRGAVTYIISGLGQRKLRFLADFMTTEGFTMRDNSISAIHLRAATAALAVGAALMLGLAAPSAQAQTVEALYRFTGGTDGGLPFDRLVGDSVGNVYGTTFWGGAYNFGTVFKVDRSGKETVLYNFTGGADGGHPFAGLVRDSASILYGTTKYGGETSCSFQGSLGCGTVFTLDLTGKESVLHSFIGGTDGADPIAGLLRDSVGNLYGTTTMVAARLAPASDVGRCSRWIRAARRPCCIASRGGRTAYIPTPV
jgi:uncharacterized repeat protein (TIGR03803 family)